MAGWSVCLGLISPEHKFDGKYEMVMDNVILFDKLVHIRDKSYYTRFRGKNAFLVHLNDETYEEDSYPPYRNFRGVFRNYWSKIFDADGVMAIPLGHSDSEPWSVPELRASQRPYLWSFVGEGKKSTRPDMLLA